jgi:hypothetical protein
MNLKIKDQYKNRKVSYIGNGKKSLKDWSQEDLNQLATLARTSGDKSLLRLFEGSLPPKEDLQVKATEKELDKLITPKQFDKDVKENK